MHVSAPKDENDRTSIVANHRKRETESARSGRKSMRTPRSRHNVMAAIYPPAEPRASITKYAISNLGKANEVFILCRCLDAPLRICPLRDHAYGLPRSIGMLLTRRKKHKSCRPRSKLFGFKERFFKYNRPAPTRFLRNVHSHLHATLIHCLAKEQHSKGCQDTEY